MARSNHNPAHIADARGRRAALLDPYSMHLLRRHDIIPPDTLRNIAREIGPGVSKWGRRAYWIGFGIGLYSIGSALVTRTLSGGRFRSRLNTITCWHRHAFSNTGSARPRVKSAPVPSANHWFVGLTMPWICG